MNYYEILECTPASNLTEIRKSYQKLALQYHPDKEKSNDAYQKYLQIDEAWKTLRDSEQRKVYDAELYQMRIDEQHNLFAELNGTVDFTENEGTLSYPCRCGDFYQIQKDDIKGEKEFLVECNQCSLVVRVRCDA